MTQNKQQKIRAIKAKEKGTHHHVGYDKLVKQIKSKNKVSDESARKIAGRIQANSIKKFGSKTIVKNGKHHVEPAI